MATPEAFARLGKAKYPGSSITPGFLYHDLPFEEYAHLPVHRSGTLQRVAHMAKFYRFYGWKGLDIGCSVGGLTMALSREGAKMTGVDADPAAIEAAEAVNAEQGTGCSFQNITVPSVEFTSVLLGGHFDFALCLSTFMWIARARGMEEGEKFLSDLARSVPVLWFETAQGPEDGMAGDATPFYSAADVERFLGKFYPHVKDTGIPAADTWFNRSLFLCWRD